MSTLYRKYRPRKFADLSGQRYIIDTLCGSIRKNRIGHAYIFTGPRGTGKTTTARIFAKAINCPSRIDVEPCNSCLSCKNSDDGNSIDIIEIDAASHTGVDNIRQLREEVRFAPAKSPYKIYIIDEVHMLSAGAFNALLKTLEEPPAHAVFILATTEIHKVPETIASRCQQFDFVRLGHTEIVDKLTKIAQSEKIKIEKSALDMIALAAEGGMRDAESILGQIMAHETESITAQEVERLCGLSDRRASLSLIESLLDAQGSRSLEIINNVSEKGLSIEHFSKSILYALRQMLFAVMDSDRIDEFTSYLSQDDALYFKQQVSKTNASWILGAIDEFLTAMGKAKLSFIPQLPLEIAAVRLCCGNSKNQATTDSPEKPLPASNPKPSPVRLASHEPRNVSTPSVPDQKRKEESRPSEKEGASIQKENFRAIDLQTVQRAWPKFLATVSESHPSIAVFLSNCDPEKIHDDGSLGISTPYSFYKEKLADRGTRLTIENILGTILGTHVLIKFSEISPEKNRKETKQAESPKQMSSETDSKKDGLVSDVLDVFGATIMR